MRASCSVFAVVVACVAGASASASAQPRSTFSSARYHPALGPQNYFALEGASSLPPSRSSYAVWLDYAVDTLVAPDPCRSLEGARQCDGRRQLAFLEQTGLVHLGYARGLGRTTQIAVDLPFGGSESGFLAYTIDAPGRNPYREVRPRDGFVFADLRVSAKSRLYASADRRLRVAAALSATLPTSLLTSKPRCGQGEDCSFLGERGTQIGALGIVEALPVPKLRVAVNAGVLVRPARDLLGSQVGSELTLGAAAAYTLVHDLDVSAEIVAALELNGLDDTPVEARGGLTYGRDLRVTLGAGAGVYRDVGVGRYRLLAGLQWTPVTHDRDGDGLRDGRDRCPDAPEDRDRFDDGDGCPDLDDDGDGLPDARDACPAEREDDDDFRDDDGCPDPDNDEDGVPDGYDSCEGPKEDHDGDHDDDGCPDHDSDRDGVSDDRDRCASAAEDTDGLADDDGCPEDDYDADGVPDVSDACPEEAETKNRLQDGDGCPD